MSDALGRRCAISKKLGIGFMRLTMPAMDYRRKMGITGQLLCYVSFSRLIVEVYCATGQVECLVTCQWKIKCWHLFQIHENQQLTQLGRCIKTDMHRFNSQISSIIRI